MLHLTRHLLLSISYLVLLFCLPLYAQEVKVSQVELGVDKKISLQGELSEGILIDKLQWAASSQVACFPATRFQEFEGKHVFYRLIVPAKVTVFVEMTPNKRINLYGINQGTEESWWEMPPNITWGNCEASYPMYAGETNMKQAGGKRTIRIVTVKPTTILLGVAGAKGVQSASFKLQIRTESHNIGG